LVIGLIVLLSESIFPNFVLDTELAIGFTIIISSYILSVTIDPGPGGWRGIFLSRKFWGAVVGLVFLFLRGFGVVIPAELSPAVIEWAAVMLGAWIASIGLETPLGLMGVRKWRERLVWEADGKKPGNLVQPSRPEPQKGPASKG
jgi:hypothetical protein